MMQVTMTAAASSRILDHLHRFSVTRCCSRASSPAAGAGSDAVDRGVRRLHADLTGVVDKGTRRSPSTGATAVNLNLQAAAGTGVVAYGQVTLINLTTGGIV
jgi:hypothetical protein